jgi:hypothetical protein
MLTMDDTDDPGRRGLIPRARSYTERIQSYFDECFAISFVEFTFHSFFSLEVRFAECRISALVDTIGSRES